jgi:hypothetical protein
LIIFYRTVLKLSKKSLLRSVWEYFVMLFHVFFFLIVINKDVELALEEICFSILNHLSWVMVYSVECRLFFSSFDIVMFNLFYELVMLGKFIHRKYHMQILDLTIFILWQVCNKKKRLIPYFDFCWFCTNIGLLDFSYSCKYVLI